MERSVKSLDWTLIFLYIVIAAFGVTNIYSVSPESGEKQLMWFGISIFVAFFVFYIRSFLWENFAPFFYGFTMILLAGVLVLGKEINGAKAWFVFGPISFQPVEAAKIAVGIMLATYCNSTHFNSRDISSLGKALAIVVFPIFLIILQPDVGSILVFTAFIVALVREGLSGILFIIGFYFAFLFLGTIYSDVVLVNNEVNSFLGFGAFSPELSRNLYVILGFTILSLLLVFIFIFFLKKKDFINNQIISIKEILVILFVFFISIGTIFITPFVKEKLPKHQRERIMVLFEGEGKYAKTAGYNLLYAKSSIANGEFLGQGYRQGPVTIGRFVPEQRTDYIFCTVGEEWGFVGSSILLILYALFIGRILFLAENMKSTFSRVYGYCIGTILLIHLIINIGMVLGLFPTVGIPLPFFSYGGSSFLAFTVQIAIFIRLKYEDNISLI